MHIVVCIKQVPDSAQIRVHPVTNTIMRQGVPAIVNPYDLFSLEEALRLKDRFGGKVTMLCMGPPQAEEALRQFEDHMKGLPEVRECHMLNGEIDFILKVVSKDLQSFQEFLTSKLTPAPNVASVKTSLTIRTAKQVPGVPMEF